MKLRLNPVYQKEIKTNVRSMKIAMIIFCYNALLAVIGLLTFFLTFETNGGSQGVNYKEILSVYMIMVLIEFGLVLFIVPAFTSGSISGERERQTLEILLTTKLKPISIVVGKLASSISMILLLVISSIPVLSIIFAIGGVGFRDLAQLVFLTFTTAVYIGSLGILFSSLIRKTIPSTVLTYGVVILLTFGTIFIVGIGYLMKANQIEQTGYYGYLNQPDVGNLMLILLVNPIFTMISMITQQYASGTLLAEILSQFGNANEFVLKHWFWISILVQMVIAAVSIFSASWFLDPLKRKSRVRKKSGSY